LKREKRLHLSSAESQRQLFEKGTDGHKARFDESSGSLPGCRGTPSLFC